MFPALLDTTNLSYMFKLQGKDQHKNLPLYTLLLAAQMSDVLKPILYV